MDEIDRKIADLLQEDSRRSSAKIAEQVGIPTSTASERIRRLSSSGVIKAWRAVLEPDHVSAACCGFVLIDMRYQGEEEAKMAIAALPEIQELHHISGAHSYLAKFRVRDPQALQQLLQQHIKPLHAVTRTETMLALETVKETTELPLPDPA